MESILFCRKRWWRTYSNFKKIYSKSKGTFFNNNKDKINLPTIDGKATILLPKQYKSSNVLIGDSGYLSYTSISLNSSQEMRLPIIVAGFYDPGVLPIGSKCLIVSDEITKTINSTINSQSFDGSSNNGINIWMKDIKKSSLLKETLLKELEKENLTSFFNIDTYKEFDFSKDLMQQFQSDRTLFLLISIIILLAACSNIISMLILLVNDKKKEIAILRSMGASKKSIATIFGLCGLIMGTVASVIGVLSAVITLKHLDTLISLLSKLQGHNMFNESFFGSKIPNELSIDSVIFILILTPILALIAGLIPAIKASKIHPSKILRS